MDIWIVYCYLVFFFNEFFLFLIKIIKEKTLEGKWSVLEFFRNW